MFPISALPDPGCAAVRVLNALLRREDWARARLARHAGKTVRLAVGALKLGLTIDSEGYAETADPAVVPDVTLTADPAKFSVARLFQGGADQPDRAATARARADAIADMTHISGDAGLAQVVAELAAQLRWDVEDDLAGLVGDIPAARLVGGARALSAGLRGAASRLGSNLVEYLSQERPVLTPRPLLEDWSADVARANAAIEGLHARMAGLRTRLERLQAQAGNPARNEVRNEARNDLHNRGAANRGNGGA